MAVEDEGVEAPAPEAPAVEAPAVSTEKPAEGAAPAEKPTEGAEEKPKSRRDMLREQLDAREKTGDGKPDDRTAIEKQRDAKTGQFKKPAEAAKPGEQKPAEAAKPGEQRPEGQPKKVPKVPAAWQRERRATWDALPEAAQKAVAAREREHEVKMAQQSETHQTEMKRWEPVHKFAESFAGVIKPYEHLMRQEAAQHGREYQPLRTIQGLLQTAASLQSHDMRTRASTMAQMLANFGLANEDGVRAMSEALAPILQGVRPEAPAPQPQHFDPKALIAQAKEEWKQELQATMDARAASEGQAEARDFLARAEEGEFEHLESVRESMAHIIDAHSRRQQSLPEEQRVDMPMEQAYRIACLADPEINPRFLKAEADAATAAAAASAKPAPAVQPRPTSSIRSRPGSPLGSQVGKPKTRRELLRKQLDDMEEAQRAQ